jgi:hypothetical protein
VDFRFPQEADNWFSHLRDKPPLRVKFDLYYLCLMLGLAAGRKADPAGPEFVGHFVDDYRSSQRLIAGLLTIAELKIHGIDMQEKSDVRRVIAELFDPNSPTGLSEEGMRNLNKYASGGFAYLSEIREKPHHADEFLADYLKILHAAVEESGSWDRSDMIGATGA